MKKFISQLLLIVFLLGIAGFCTFEIKNYYQKNVPREKVLVAKVDIPSHTIITFSDMKYVMLPMDSVLPGSFQDPYQLNSRETLIPIYRDEQFLAPKFESSPLALGADDRVISLPTDIVRVDGLCLARGSIVDVWMVQKLNPSGNGNQGNGTAAAPVPPALVAPSAIVLDVLNNSNVSIFAPASATSSSGSSNSAASITNTNSNGSNAVLPTTVVLKTMSSYVPVVMNGLGNNNNYFYLVKVH